MTHLNLLDRRIVLPRTGRPPWGRSGRLFRTI